MVSRNPEFVDAWGNLSSFLRKLGRREEAFRACERALALARRVEGGRRIGVARNGNPNRKDNRPRSLDPRGLGFQGGPAREEPAPGRGTC